MRLLTSALAFLGLCYLAWLAGCGSQCHEGEYRCDGAQILDCQDGREQSFPGRKGCGQSASKPITGGAGGSALVSASYGCDWSGNVEGDACPAAFVGHGVCADQWHSLVCISGIWRAASCPTGCGVFDGSLLCD